MDKVNEQVLEFNKTSGADIAKQPRIPQDKTADLRIDLLREELKEFEEALYKGDKVGVLDALCDLQYVLTGAVQACGMADVFEEAFNEVHASNMSKFCKNTEQARKSADDYTIKKGVHAHYKKVGPLFVILRNDDDKILKGSGFFNPRLKAILEKFEKNQHDAKQQTQLL